MRLSCVVLIAVTTLFTTGSAVTAIDRSAVLSTMASANLAGMNRVSGGEKRSLRYHGKENDVDKEDEDEDDEERTINVALLDDMLAKLNKSDPTLINMFEQLKTGKFTSYNLPKIADHSKYDDLRKAYRTWLYHHSG
ncbi:hypothetical protein PHMEG_00031988 [Phytophthora megakarya]|uniref:RxLR effector protein n=1 Tax=Phytophthora megakarya TaxID=4795 RepID=A0A225UXB7_9STRA|nr:hypothetical protein PHMEG_00031988 [Phytophthora megakarya]